MRPSPAESPLRILNGRGRQTEPQQVTSTAPMGPLENTSFPKSGSLCLTWKMKACIEVEQPRRIPVVCRKQEILSRFYVTAVFLLLSLS